jgi:hypothetical protein
VEKLEGRQLNALATSITFPEGNYEAAIPQMTVTSQAAKVIQSNMSSAKRSVLCDTQYQRQSRKSNTTERVSTCDSFVSSINVDLH